MKKILIITAHLDDFELGMGGTASKLCKHHEVYLLVLCRGDRPGHEYVGTPRKVACKNNCRNIGMRDVILYDYSDTKLDSVSQTELCNLLHHHINVISPETVYTHYSDDVHNDHCILSRVTRVACRMRHDNSVNSLLEFTIPGSTEWRHTPKYFNVFEDITETVNDKIEMICEYTSELRQPPDPISLEMILARDKYHGSLCGVPYAEIFSMIFKRCI